MPIPDAIFAAAPQARPVPVNGRGPAFALVPRRADVIFREGKYPFPADAGGPFEMTAAEIKSLVAGFSKPVPLEDTHHASVFNGKLGELVKVTSRDDGKTFSGEVHIPKWFHDLFPNEPIKLSPRFNRRTKQLTRLAVVPNPRIPDAAMFAAFSEAEKEDEAEAAVEEPEIEEEEEEGIPPPGSDSGMRPSDACHKAEQKCHDIIQAALAASDITEAERDKLTAMLAAITGEEEAPEDEMDPMNPGDDAAAGNPYPETPPSEALMSKRDKAFQAQIKDLQEARFADQQERWHTDSQRFALDLVRADKITPASALGVAEAYFQACLDDRKHPTEVCFSDEKGAKVKGKRLDALKARYLTLPKLGLQSELAGDGKRSEMEALFNTMETPGMFKGNDDKPMTPERKRELLSKSRYGQAILRDQKRAETNGAGTNGKK